ncbi:flagellar biosynthetic protein FliO [Roseibium marinum]|uniref:Flagellar biosynthesis protein FliO n=1 Tax=Roseibium marinum TaxID=281252 RepID=A0A2S3UKH2_9HYPH|nr:flagellar biosynthetic protein FliO [Roseibium marinum]POF28207.1 flagellar biosynthesis protein FliO [Roseibium marinum]
MYNWIQTTFNVSGSVTQAVAVILALAVVLLLFGLFIFILKRLTGTNAPQNRNRQPRIAVMDSAPIDTKRRLVLIRRDNIEHLILVGGPSDVVVEQNIVRNAPLTASRPGTYPGAGLAGPGQIKSPMAPGPDIPFRPDDRLPDAEPGTLAAQAAPVRPPVTVAYSDPDPEAGPAAVRETAASVPAAAEKTQASPVLPRPVQSKSAPVAAARPLTADTESEAATGSTRAADLLRAATQNGFNRTLARAPATPVPAQDIPAGGRKAPEVKTEPAVSGEDAAASADKPASELSSLPRSFASRERPAYAGHSITPPASGPAARAKTALMKPSDTVPQRIEPLVAPHGAGAGSPEPRISAETSRSEAKAEPEHRHDPVRPALAAAGAAMSAADLPETGPAAGNTESDANVDTGPQETAPSASGDLSDVITLAPDTPPGPGTEPAQVPSQADSPTPAQNPGSQDPVQRDIVLELDDLIAVDAPQPAARPAPDEHSSAMENAGPEELVNPAPPAEEPSSDVKPGDDRDKPAAKPPAGLSDKNPIEEEMAKILDELGGQPN